MNITIDIHAIAKSARENLLHPKQFFVKTKKEKSWKDAFSYLVVVALVGHILTGLFAVIVSTGQEAGFGITQIVPAVLISYFLTLAMSFVWGGALKVWLGIFKVESTFAQGFKIMVYSRTPNLLLSWVPILNFFSALYSFYLLVVGLTSEYGVSRRKGIIVVLSSLAIMFVLSILLFAVFPQV